MDFGYDVSVMISWFFSCPKQLSIKITFIVYLVMFDCEF